jgi:hypothetical protein
MTLRPPGGDRAYPWLKASTSHYLGADGPEGSAPLEFVDASRRRIALAMGRGEAVAGQDEIVEPAHDLEASGRRQGISVAEGVD